MNQISIKKTLRHIKEKIMPQFHLTAKITLILLFCCVSNSFSTNLFSQNSINLKGKNATVEEILNSIEEQTNYRFVYNKEFVNVNRKIEISSSNENVLSVLDKMFKEDDVAYAVFNNQIVLSKKTKIRELELQEMAQSTPPVKGVIVDEKNEPLPGVSISVKGSTKGTMTDLDGKFSLDASNGQTLTISYIGFISQEIKVGDNKSLRIILQENILELEDVVVVGFGTQKKESITGSISAISGKELMTTNASTTSTALAGKISGINSRQSDGRPGSGTKIRIRGMGTPLYVIDGVQKDEGQFNNIDPNDIESISILKDASAAIYGVRAANGVIVVQTKSGKRNTKNTINITSSYGWQNMFKFPKPADTKTYVRAKYQSDMIKKASDSGFNPKYSADDLAKWEQGTEKGYQGWDWHDYILETSPMYYVGGNISGGSDNINYYLSLSHLNQDAIIVNYGGFKRTNMQMNIDANVTPKLKIGGSMNGRIETRKNPGVPGGDDYWQALFAIYRNLPTMRPFANDNPDYPAKTSSNNATNFGMLNYERAGKLQETWRVIQLNLSAEYQILKELKLNILGGYYLADKMQDNHEFTYKLYEYDEGRDEYKVVDTMDNPYMERTYEKKEETSGQFIFTYNQKFNVHNVAATFGGEAMKRTNPYLWYQDRPAANVINQTNLTTMVNLKHELDRTEARAGFIGRVNYDYDRKYLIELIGRYDGSWKFPKNDRWGFFPSVSAGWRISEEPFWSGIKDKVSDLKLKASYGVVGLDETDGYKAYDYLDGYIYRKEGDNEKAGAVMNGEWVIGTQPRGLAVKTLSWMEAKMFNIGADFTVLGDKLSGDFSYFTRKLDGIPESRYDVLIPTETGFSLPKENLNSEMNKGFEGSLVWRDKISDLNYSVSGNFTYSRKYDWHQYKPRFGNSWDEFRNSKNERYAHINWGKQVVGQFQSWEDIANHAIDNDGKGNTTLRPGDFMYKDVNGDGAINDMDDRPIGYREGEVPYLNYNFVFNFDYKGFDLGLTFGGSSFASFFMEWELRNPLHDGGNNPQFMLDNQWKLSDINNPYSSMIPGKYPTVREGNASHANYWRNDFWLKNVNYIKLRNLELGYTLPKPIVQKAGIQKVRFFTSMQNLFTIDNLGDIDIDPEITEKSGIQYPTSRVISIGCNLTF